MERHTKLLLTLTGITFPAGLLLFTGIINVDAIPALHVVFPIGAILFGMFLIAFALEKQVAAFDAEQRAREHSVTAESAPEPDRNRNSPREGQTDDWQRHAIR